MAEPSREILVDEDQRRAEQQALRNVRSGLDAIAAEEVEKRRIRKFTYWALAILACALFAMVLRFVFFPRSRVPPPEVKQFQSSAPQSIPLRTSPVVSSASTSRESAAKATEGSK